MKKIMTMVIIALSVFLIYLGFKDKEIYYLSLGDGLAYGVTPYGGKDYGYSEFIRDYLEKKNKLEVYVDGNTNLNKRSIDIINDIKDNVEIDVNGKKKTLQNVLIKADLITLSIGMNDFLSDVNLDMEFSANDLYHRFESGLKDLEQLFQLLREYCKEDIVMIGYYSNHEDTFDVLKSINQKVAKVASNYNIDYIDIQDILKDSDYFLNQKSRFPDKKGYQAISEAIIEQIDKKLLKNT